MRALRIAKEVALPIDAVTQTMAAIGRKGAGKTYLATMVAEQMLDNRAQVVVIDPVGNWWGLRVGADGRSKGKEIFVIGGDHGDVPLVPEAGARIARLLVEKRVSAVLDISGFRIGEHKRFAADFAEEFFHLKKSHKSPVHIFIEEAQKVIPQRVGPDEARMVGAFEQIVRLGRNYGIGCTLVTQRPQSVNKEVLSQVECLCVLQITGPHERKALEEWVQEAGADRKLIGELPGLERGEGYVWSPSWLRIYKRVHFATKTTFDASSTPEVGKKTRAASVSAVDVKALREDIAEVVAAAEKDDPKALRRRIAELERAPRTAPIPTQKDIKDSIGQAVKDALAARDKEWLQVVRAWLGWGDMVVSWLKKMPSMDIAKLPQRPKGAPVLPSAPAIHVTPPPPPRAPAHVEYHPSPETLEEGEVSAGPRKILTAIAQYPEGATRAQLTVMTGYKRSSRDIYVAMLKKYGHVEQRGDKLVATQRGIQELGDDYQPLPTGAELRDHLMRTLPEGEKKILALLIESYPQALDRETISNSTEYKRSSRDIYIANLKARQLVETGPGTVKAADNLF